MIRRTRFWIVAAAAALLVASCAPGLDAGDRERAGVLLAEAEAMMASGLALRESDPERAETAFRDAFARYETVHGMLPAPSGAFLRTAGTAALLAGDTGSAVLNLKRAVRRDPGDLAARDALAEARDRVGVVVAEPARWRGWAARVWAIAVAWAPVVGIGAYAGAWVLGATGVLWGRPRGRVVLALAGVAVACAVVAVWPRWLDADRDAVVVIAEVTGRNGPGEGVYPATFDAPLAPGVEARATEIREGWARLRFGGSETWVPLEALQWVMPGGLAGQGPR